MEDGHSNVHRVNRMSLLINAAQYNANIHIVEGLVSKETLCCVGGGVVHGQKNTNLF